MPQQLPALHYTIVVVDVARFTARTMTHQLAVREGLFTVLRAAFAEAGVDWGACVVEDRGDGMLILVPPEVPKSQLVDQLPGRLVAELRRYNAVHSDEAAFQLRVGLHAGEVSEDEHGAVSQALSLAFRILEASEAKSALTLSAGVLALIASDDYYRTVIIQEPAADPGSYRRITVSVKGTSTVAWLRLPDGASVADRETPGHERISQLAEESRVRNLPLPVSIYLEDGQRSTVRAVRAALQTVAEEAGFKLIEESAPVYGSFWQRFRATVSEPQNQEALNQRLIKLERAAEVRLLAVPESQANMQNAQGLALIIESLREESAAVVQLGPLVVVKTCGTILSRILTPKELQMLEGRPDLLRDPASLMAQLTDADRTVR